MSTLIKMSTGSNYRVDYDRKDIIYQSNLHYERLCGQDFWQVYDLDRERTVWINPTRIVCIEFNAEKE